MAEVIEIKSPINETLIIEAGNNKKIITVATRQLTLVAITGGFRGGKIFAKNRTKDVKENSESEKIFLNAKSISEEIGISFNGIFIQPGLINILSLDLAVDFIKKTHDNAKDILLIYGYSNGGDYAMDLARELEDEMISINKLITVDATDRLGRNASVSTQIPKNVRINHNYYQREDCGKINCARGDANTPFDGSVTTVINKEIKEKNVGKKVLHSEMESLVKDDILENIQEVMRIK